MTILRNLPAYVLIKTRVCKSRRVLQIVLISLTAVDDFVGYTGIVQEARQTLEVSLIHNTGQIHRSAWIFSVELHKYVSELLDLQRKTRPKPIELKAI